MNGNWNDVYVIRQFYDGIKYWELIIWDAKNNLKDDTEYKLEKSILMTFIFGK